MALELPFKLSDIKPGTFAYLTKRKLKNKEKEDTGEIIIWRNKEEEESRYVVKCPFCGDEHEGSSVFTKRPYRIRCVACNKSIMVSKLLNEAKKDRKAKK